MTAGSTCLRGQRADTQKGLVCIALLLLSGTEREPCFDLFVRQLLASPWSTRSPISSDAVSGPRESVGLFFSEIGRFSNGDTYLSFPASFDLPLHHAVQAWTTMRTTWRCHRLLYPIHVTCSAPVSLLLGPHNQGFQYRDTR
jgi:hypothetical protein